jgi:hypothetical protein
VKAAANWSSRLLACPFGIVNGDSLTSLERYLVVRNVGHDVGGGRFGTSAMAISILWILAIIHRTVGFWSVKTTAGEGIRPPVVREELTDKALHRGVFHSVPDLIAKIEDYLAAHNKDPKPFVWTATADDILAKVARGRVALQAVNQ